MIILRRQKKKKITFSGSLHVTGFKITSTHIIFHLEATQLVILTVHINILRQKLAMRPERCGLTFRHHASYI